MFLFINGFQISLAYLDKLSVICPMPLVFPVESLTEFWHKLNELRKRLLQNIS